MTRPDTRFVPIKSAEQQATLSLHKTRELLTKQRTMASMHYVRIPTKPAMHSNLKPATYTDLKPATVPI